MPYYNRDPKRDHNFDNHPYIYIYRVHISGPKRVPTQLFWGVLTLLVRFVGGSVFFGGALGWVLGLPKLHLVISMKRGPYTDVRFLQP